MADNVRFANAKLLAKKLGGIETNIVPNMFAGFVSQKYGFKTHACPNVGFFSRYEEIETEGEEKISS